MSKWEIAWSGAMRLKTSGLLLVLMLALVFPLSVQAQGQGPVYIVQQGDTLSGIAWRFGTTIEALILENNISDPSRIFPGMELTIPGFPEISGRLSLEPVRLGDTFESLSHDFDLDQTSLKRLNRIVRPDRIYAGMSLIVAATEQGLSAQPARHLLAARPGETRLELAARARTDPWAIHTDRTPELQLWVLPGDLYGFGSRADEKRSGLPDEVNSLTISPEPLIQGHTTEIHVTASSSGRIEGDLGEHRLAFFPLENDRWISLQGIHALAEPGLLDLRLGFYESDASAPFYEFQQPVLLESGDYGFQVLNGVPPETIDPAVTGPEDAFVTELLAAASPQKLWQGPFEYPSRYYTAEFVATFGTRRSYNNGSLMYYHTGVDFYGRDEPIYAPAAGRVVFAGPLTVRGNVTYIDHGWGVYSGYLHQSEMYVQEGDQVEKGQVIGKVGATGRVTGPHLHWEVWVGDVPVQPLDWISPGYLLPEDPQQ
jgi:murein DD-endopeptidase MepM/ murein hydrolase activator NlpD